jgi:putative phosphonate metabolism protein
MAWMVGTFTQGLGHMTASGSGGFARYAVYFTPEPGPLAEFGAAWLGWDSATGTPRAHPAVAGLPAPVSDLTARPRKYGFHGTIKPPFRLRHGTDADALSAALAVFCADAAPVTLAGLRLARMGGFVALVPDGPVDGLARLAAGAVEALDGFRAPPTDAETARRKPDRLTARQREMLARWGYPFTHAEFRFHMTLTGPVGAQADAVRAALDPVLTPRIPRPFRVDALTLLGADAQDRFHQIARYPLSGG